MATSLPTLAELRFHLTTLRFDTPPNTLDELKHRYAELAIATHPDITGDDGTEFRDIALAYEILLPNFDRLKYVESEPPSDDRDSETTQTGSVWDDPPFEPDNPVGDQRSSQPEPRDDETPPDDDVEVIPTPQPWNAPAPPRSRASLIGVVAMLLIVVLLVASLLSSHQSAAPSGPNPTGGAGARGAPGGLATATVPPSTSTAPASDPGSGNSTSIQSGDLAPGSAPGTFSGAVGGTSEYSQGGYSVSISPPSVSGISLLVPYDATGQSNLRDPSTSCIDVAGGTYVVHPYRDEVSANGAGHYMGTLVFPLFIPGSYSFSYSCQTDYSAVAIGDFDSPIVGLSVYSLDPQFVASVISVSQTSTATVVQFAVNGSATLRDPSTSCINANGSSVVPTTNISYKNPGDLSTFLTGTMTFPPNTRGEFIYSCQSDYSSVPIG